MSNCPELNFKSDQEIKEHFILRLEERYDISLTDDEYNDIHHPKGFTNSKILTNYIHWAKISSVKSAFIITLKNQLILTIYSNDRSKFITALPWHSYNDETRFVPAILKKLYLKGAAIEKYNQILSICAKEYVDLGNGKDNYHYYKNNCTYPGLLMTEYKGGLTVGRIYNQVIKELTTT